MINDSQLLNFVRQNIQMGIDGIKLVIDDTVSEDFKAELKNQMEEYDDIYAKAEDMVEELGVERHDVNAAAKIAAHLSGKMKTMSGSTSKIAESMIQGTTMGVTKLIKHMNEFNGSDTVLNLAKKLISVEERNIETLKKYL